MNDRLGLWSAYRAECLRAGQSPLTLRARGKQLAMLADYADLADVTVADLRAWLGRPGLSAQTVHSYQSGVRKFYRWVVAEGLLDRDPTLRLLPVRVRAGLPRPVDVGELDRALEAAGPTMRRYLLLMRFAGLRCAEVASLRGEDLGGDPPMIRVIGKGGVAAAVPMHPVLVAELADVPRGWVFPGQRAGTHVHAGSVSNLVARHFAALGIDATAHQVRHRFGTDVYRQSGRSLRMAQELLRHASPATTAVYTKLDPGEAVDVIGRLGA